MRRKIIILAAIVFVLLALGIVVAESPVYVDPDPIGFPTTGEPQPEPGELHFQIKHYNTTISQTNGVYILPEDDGNVPSHFYLVGKNLDDILSIHIALRAEKAEIIGKFYSLHKAGLEDENKGIPFQGARAENQPIDITEKFTCPYDKECEKNNRDLNDCTLKFESVNGKRLSDYSKEDQIQLTVLIDKNTDNKVQEEEISQIIIQLAPKPKGQCNSIVECLAQIDKQFVDGIYE